MMRPGTAALALLARPTWSDVWFGALIQWAIFVPLLAVLIALATPTPLGLSVAVGSPLLSAVVGALVTVALGAPLAMLLARWLARSEAWILHLVAFLGLGFVLAGVLIHLWMLVIGDFWDSPAWFASMYVFLPIVSAAALSVGAGWSIAWRRAVMRERAELPVLAQ